MVPFLTVMNYKNDTFQPYMAPVNHNSIASKLVVSITSTMLGNYCQDESADSNHLQDMGADAGVLFGYDEKVRMLKLKWKNIPILKIFPLTYQYYSRIPSLSSRKTRKLEKTNGTQSN
jgi:hypothetical protein